MSKSKRTNKFEEDWKGKKKSVGPGKYETEIDIGRQPIR